MFMEASQVGGLERFFRDPAVGKWLACYDVESRRGRWRKLRMFLSYLEGHQKLGGLGPSELVAFQRGAGKAEEFLILDALQDHIRGKSGTYGSLLSHYSVVKSFFRRNRVPLPEDTFEINANRSPVSGKLTVEIIKSLVENVGVNWKAFYLTLWMSLMDLERFMIFNRSCAGSLVKHLKEKGVGEPYLFDYPGRKKMRGKKVYYTFLGCDALAAWIEYFERMRGWPSEGEPILLDQDGKAVRKQAIRMRHLRLLEKLKYVKLGGSPSNRYGYNLHEFRDVARTLLHLQGRKDQLDLDCVEFWMGHTTDPNQYDKFYMDKNYTLEQYRIAEKYLNIMSGSSMGPQLQNADEMIELIIKNKPAFEKL
ncbi:MAG: hypothetical protein NTX81_10850, partial [Candidatus Bathyarchaeota archaeon]|nr:hypothetical protein [Candidatus Bathyarchaeota archaeon]